MTTRNALLFAIWTLCILQIGQCQTPSTNELERKPGSRAYQSDAGTLDFVYHDHEEMTRFLRLAFLFTESLPKITKNFPDKI